jgi:hypothetical protein
MAINRGPWNALVDDDGSNLVGSIWNKAAIKDVILDPTDAALVEQSASLGAIAPVPFNAGSYGVYPSGAWTVTAGNVLAFMTTRIGKLGVIALYVANSTITGTPLLLSVANPLPPSAGRTVGAGRFVIGGTLEAGNCYVELADNRLYFQRNGGLLFPAGVLGELSVTLSVFLA